ncbi:MAG: 3-deoxy-8-phosphooctulonate synthase [Nitrospirae bacterium]|nr:3-deoxy-8-phosphooctulonate synthase [Nitrospirota bacterium]
MNLIDVFRERKLLVIAGPCVMESRDLVLKTAEGLKAVSDKLAFPLLFKSSYDKANRSSLSGFRGPAMESGLALLSEVRQRFGLDVITDAHSAEEVRAVARVADVIQIPAFLCRQTDIILAASLTGKWVNVKKGQFLAPWDAENIVEKFLSTGNQKIMITERGTTFGYNNIVVDFRGIPIMRAFGKPVIFDVTHSVQIPGGQGKSSGGQRQFAPPLARAAVAVGVDGLFMEVHPDPDNALCDGPNMIKLSDFEALMETLLAIHGILKDKDFFNHENHENHEKGQTY